MFLYTEILVILNDEEKFQSNGKFTEVTLVILELSLSNKTLPPESVILKNTSGPSAISQLLPAPSVKGMEVILILVILKLVYFCELSGSLGLFSSFVHDHIGKIIKEQVKRKGISVTEFAEKINYSRRNVYEIFDKETIDTGLLIKINKIIDQNLFLLYLTDSEVTAIKNKSDLTNDVMEILLEIKKSVGELKKSNVLKTKANKK
jgi:hypothetical protein